MFSNWSYESNLGRVVLFFGGVDDEFVVKEWIGESEGDRIGEVVWIAEDSIV